MLTSDDLETMTGPFSRADLIRVLRSVMHREPGAEKFCLVIMEELLLDAGRAQKLREEIAQETRHATPPELEAMAQALANTRKAKT